MIHYLSGQILSQRVDLYSVKYHEYLFDHNSNDILNDKDIKTLQKIVPWTDIINLESSYNGVDPHLIFYILLFVSSNKFTMDGFVRFDHFFSARLMFLLITDRTYGQRVAEIILQLLDSGDFKKLAVECLKDKPHINVKNIQRHAEYKHYFAEMKILAQDKLGKLLVKQLRSFVKMGRGGDLLGSNDTKHHQLRINARTLANRIVTTFVRE